MAPMPIIVSPTAGTMRSCATATSARTRYATPVTRLRRTMTRQCCGMKEKILSQRRKRLVHRLGWRHSHPPALLLPVSPGEGDLERRRSDEGGDDHHHH